MKRVVSQVFLIAVLLLGITPKNEAAVTMTTTGATLATDNFTHNQWLGNRIHLAEDASAQSATGITMMLDVVYDTPFLCAFILGDTGAQPSKADIIASFGLDAASLALVESSGGATAAQLSFTEPQGSAGILEPGKSYWIVAGVTGVNYEATAGQEMGLLHWYWGSSNMVCTDGWTVDSWVSASNTNGAEWGSFAGAPYVFGLSTIAVPEPSRILFLLFGGLALLCRRARVLAVGSLLVACDRTTPQTNNKAKTDDVIATVGTETIHADDFRSAAQRRGVTGTDLAPRNALLDELIDESILVQRARKQGIEQSPEFQHRLRALLIATMREQEPATSPSPAVPTEAQLKSLYEELKTKLRIPGAQHLALIQASGPDAAMRLDEAIHRYHALPADPKRRGFGAIAAEYSEDQNTRYTGGDLGWITAPELQRRFPAEVTVAAEKLSPSNPCSPVILSGALARVLLLVESRPESTPAFEAVQKQLVAEYRRRQSTLQATSQHDALRQEQPVSVNEQLLKTLPLIANPTPSHDTPPSPQ